MEFVFVFDTLCRKGVDFPYWFPPGGSLEGSSARFVNTAVTCENLMYGVYGPDHIVYLTNNSSLSNGTGVFNGEVFEVNSTELRHLENFWVSQGFSYSSSHISVRYSFENPLTSLSKKIYPVIQATVFMIQSLPKIIECGLLSSLKNYSVSYPLIQDHSYLRNASCSSIVVPVIEPLLWRLSVNRELVPFRPFPIILIIIDGIGDYQYSEYKQKTPCEVVNTKFIKETHGGLSYITRFGVSGIMDPVASGVACGSDTAHLSILGYDPNIYYHGRGAFETLGANVRLGADGRDIAFKCNFANWDSDSNVVVSRCCDTDFSQDGSTLCGDLDGLVITKDIDGVNLGASYNVHLKYTVEHRCVVVISGPGMTSKVSGTDPLRDGEPLCLSKPTMEMSTDDPLYNMALQTARVVNAVSARFIDMLKSHPVNHQRAQEGKCLANIILLRSPATNYYIPPFRTLHGLYGFMVAPTCVIRGIGICCGLELGPSAGTGDYDSQLQDKISAVEQGFRENPLRNFALIHIKGVDHAGHRRSLDSKIMMLQRISHVIKKLWDNLPENSTVAIVSDHSTPVAIGDHSCEPVPCSIATKSSANLNSSGEGFRLSKLPNPSTLGLNNNFDEENSVLHKSQDEEFGPDSIELCDKVLFYDEIACSEGMLGRFSGISLIPLIKRIHMSVYYPTGSKVQ